MSVEVKTVTLSNPWRIAKVLGLSVCFLACCVAEAAVLATRRVVGR